MTTRPRAHVLSVALVTLVVVAGSTTGCAVEAESDEAEALGGAALSASGPAPRAGAIKTMCFGGRTLGDPYQTGGIRELDDLCKTLPGLVRDVAGGPDAAYPFFQWNSSLAHELDVLVRVLDTNHDGNVTNTDEPVELNLVGYSWGGFNARDVAAALADDPRFSPSRRAVRHLIGLDAFRTDYLVWPRGDIEIPANVGAFYSFRHTKAPTEECSRIMFGLVGPFTGRDPRCTGTTECHDYDFSLAPATSTVDHCDVPRSATAYVVDIVNDRPPTGLPPARTVARD